MVNHLPVILRPLLKLCIGVAFILSGIYSFGNTELTDYIFIGSLATTMLFCRHNKIVLYIISIILLERVIEESIWFLFTRESAWFLVDHTTSFEIKAICYLVLGIALWKVRYDKDIWRFVAPAFIATVAAELYWFVTDYNSPQIMFLIVIMFQNMLVLRLIYRRPKFVAKHFPKQGTDTDLDWDIYVVYEYTIYMQILVLAEYLVRHIAGVNITWAYTGYSYIMHFVSFYILYAIFKENFRLLLPRKMDA